MANRPYFIRDDIGVLWSKALAIAGDATVVWPVRGHAASICRLLAPEVDFDDALALRAVEAASACAACFPYAHDLLIAARIAARNDAVLVDPVLIYCAKAHEAGRHGAVVTALAELVRLPAFDCLDAVTAWLIAVRCARHEEGAWLRRLLVRWVRRFGAEHEGIRAVVRARADEWLPVRRFRVDVLRAIQAVEPTPAGWVALARQREELRPGPLGLSFGDRHADAVLALRLALLRQLPPDAHATLERWLREITE